MWEWLCSSQGHSHSHDHNHCHEGYGHLGSNSGVFDHPHGNCSNHLHASRWHSHEGLFGHSHRRHYSDHNHSDHHSHHESRLVDSSATLNPRILMRSILDNRIIAISYTTVECFDRALDHGKVHAGHSHYNQNRQSPYTTTLLVIMGFMTVLTTNPSTLTITCPTLWERSEPTEIAQLAIGD